jgi:hypothetical protein
VTCNDGTTRTFQFGWSLTPDGSHAAHLSEFRDLTMLCLCPRSGKGPHLYPELDFSGIVGDFDSVWGLPDSAYPSCLRGLYAIGLTVNKMEHGYAWVAPEDYLAEIGDTSVLDALMTAGETRSLSPEDIPAILATWYACSDCDGVECDGWCTPTGSLFDTGVLVALRFRCVGNCNRTLSSSCATIWMSVI